MPHAMHQCTFGTVSASVTQAFDDALALANDDGEETGDDEETESCSSNTGSFDSEIANLLNGIIDTPMPTAPITAPKTSIKRAREDDSEDVSSFDFDTQVLPKRARLDDTLLALPVATSSAPAPAMTPFLSWLDSFGPIEHSFLPIPLVSQSLETQFSLDNDAFTQLFSGYSF
jgi:hypothetical protein